MDLRELRFALRRYWPGAVVVFVVCLLIGAAAAYLPEKTYASTAKLFAQPRALDEAGTDPARATSFIIPGLIEKVESNRFRADTRDRVPEQYRGASIAVEAAASTSVVSVRVEGPRRDAVAAWANALAAELLEAEDPGSFVSLTLLDDARVPGSAVEPKPLPILVGSAVLGVLAGFLLVIVASRARRAFDAEEDIRQLLGASLLAELPVVRQLRGRTDRTLFEVLESPGSELAEAFQTLRTEIEFRLVDPAIRAITVTSYEPGDGKSTVAAGLAWSLARVGHTVALVDADLRGPSIHRLMNQPMTTGLADLDEADVESALRATSTPGLHYLPAGLPHSQPADVISVKIPRLLDAVGSDSRILIVDSPPLGVKAEAPIIVKATRYVILVVDRANWNLPEVGDAVSRLSESGAVLLGVVVNGVPRRHWRRKNRSYYPTRRATVAGAERGRDRSQRNGGRRRPAGVQRPV